MACGVRLRSLLVVARLVMGHAQVEPVLETLRKPVRDRRGSSVRPPRSRRPQTPAPPALPGRRASPAATRPASPHSVAPPRGLSFRGIGHQVRERLLAPRIARQHLAVVLHGFREPAGLLQGHGLAEQRLLVIGEEIQILVERFQRLGRAPAVNQARCPAPARRPSGWRRPRPPSGKIPRRLANVFRLPRQTPRLKCAVRWSGSNSASCS